MQLDLPNDEVMMEVDPDFPITTAPIATSTSPPNQNPPPSPHSTPRPSLPGINTQVHSPTLSRSSLEGVAPAFAQLPTPPVVLIDASDTAAWPKFKLDQLFVEWLARPESRKWLENLLDAARAGKPPEQLLADQSSRYRSDRAVSPSPRINVAPHAITNSPPQQVAPGSPVSRLFRNHVPFGEADSSPRSPPPTPNAQGSTLSPLSNYAHLQFDLGRSGSASPLSLGTGALEAKTPISVKMVPDITSASNAEPAKHVNHDQVASEQRMKAAEAVVEEAPEKDPTANKQSSEETHDHKDSREHVVTDVSSAVENESKHSPQQMTTTPGKNEVTMSPLEQDAKPVDQAENSTNIVSPIMNSVKESPMVDQSPHQATVMPGPEMQLESEAKVAPASPLALDVSEDKKISTDNKAENMTKDQIIPNESHPQEKEYGQSESPMDISRNIASGRTPPCAPKQRSSSHTSSPAKRAQRIPQFYFPCGKDAEAREMKEQQAIKDFFQAQRANGRMNCVSRGDIPPLIVEVFGLPSFFSGIIFSAIQKLFPSEVEQDGDQRMRDSERLDNEEMKDIEQGQGSGRVDGATVDGPRTADTTYATNSDTPMGDVEESRTISDRLNGVINSSDGAVLENQRMSPGENKNPASKKVELVTEEQVSAYYKKFCLGRSKDNRLFTALRKPSEDRDYLVPDDFKPLLRALLINHQGLAFLHATPEFQQRYSETVIERIYFGCTRQHNGRLTLNDIKRSKLLETLMVVDDEEDINRERKYFSYEHFYVLYCRFWELDANHDLQIDREDLMRYGSHSLTYRIVDRIFGGFARPLDCSDNPGHMSYTDFIWFCLSEEDKTSDTAIDYWFRCVDMDGDGLITMFDMEYFYREQLHRMECFGHEPVQIRDILCQLLDMIKPNMKPPVIRRKDLKRCRLAGNFFNVLFNLNKFFAIEARDPLQIRQEHATPELTDWDRFAALEYLRLSAEEEGEEDESWEEVGDSANPLMSGEAPF